MDNKIGYKNMTYNYKFHTFVRWWWEMRVFLILHMKRDLLLVKFSPLIYNILEPSLGQYLRKKRFDVILITLLVEGRRKLTFIIIL